jgi:hypothetical protein
VANVTDQKPKISCFKVVVAIALIFSAAAAAYFFQPRYHANDEALASLVSIFSILAGFLAAIMAVVANDRALKGRTWRHDSFYLLEVKKELSKHQLLFYMYLITLALAFFCQLGKETAWPLQEWFERLLMFIAFLSMCMSFALPARLTKRQVQDLEKVISDRMEKQTNKRG